MSYHYRIYVLNNESSSDSYGDTMPICSQQSMQDCKEYMQRLAAGRYYYVKHEPSDKIEYVHSSGILRDMTSHSDRKFEHPEMVRLVVSSSDWTSEQVYSDSYLSVVITDGSYDSTSKAVTLKLLNDFHFTLKVTDFTWSYVDAK